MTTDGASEEHDASRPRRRPRYRGSHPRAFAERYKELDASAHPGIVEHVRAQGRTPAGMHVPVLLDEVLTALRPMPGEIVADCTLGYGGHAQAFLERVAPDGRLIGFDVDAAQLERTADRLSQVAQVDGATTAPPGAAPRVTLHRMHFAGLGKTLAADGLVGYDVILADLGVSSMQIDDPARGFSYKYDGPLDMRMDSRLPRTAADLLQARSEAELSGALQELADEPRHVAIARGIVAARARRPLSRTRELVRVVFGAKRLSAREWREQARAGGAGLHPAARTFQALRMLVNDEIGGLEQLLRIAPWCLAPGGRLGIITFHSGEERRVRESFESGLRDEVYASICPEPIRPTAGERRDNPRSASARLHWARVE